MFFADIIYKPLVDVYGFILLFFYGFMYLIFFKDVHFKDVDVIISMTVNDSCWFLTFGLKEDHTFIILRKMFSNAFKLLLRDVTVDYYDILICDI